PRHPAASIVEIVHLRKPVFLNNASPQSSIVGELRAFASKLADNADQQAADRIGIELARGDNIKATDIIWLDDKTPPEERALLLEGIDGQKAAQVLGVFFFHFDVKAIPPANER